VVWIHQNKDNTEFWRMTVLVVVLQVRVRVMYEQTYCSRGFKPHLRHAGVSGFDRCCVVLFSQNCKWTTLV
jgi:hypothetical protein